jgi:hypothetical protein
MRNFFRRASCYTERRWPASAISSHSKYTCDGTMEDELKIWELVASGLLMHSPTFGNRFQFLQAGIDEQLEQPEHHHQQNQFVG